MKKMIIWYHKQMYNPWHFTKRKKERKNPLAIPLGEAGCLYAHAPGALWLSSWLSPGSSLGVEDLWLWSGSGEAENSVWWSKGGEDSWSLPVLGDAPSCRRIVRHKHCNTKDIKQPEQNASEISLWEFTLKFLNTRLIRFH